MERRVLRPAAFVPIEAKFRPSVRNDGLVLRGQIVDRLLEVSDRPVVAITAPPGYGKTVLMSQWAEEDPRPFAWLTLDEGDSDPVVFVTYVVLALHRLEAVDAGVLADLARDHHVDHDAIASALLRIIGTREQAFVLVLDRADAVMSPEVRELLRVLVENVPRGSQLVVASRSGAGLDLTELRARGMVYELGVDDLRLSRAEAIAVLDTMDVQLEPGDVDRLLERTEGWAAGVYLSSHALREAKTLEPVGSPSRADELISAYLHDELLESLASDDRAFLVRTSILDALSASLCDRVLESDGSQAVLRRLAGANVLVEPVAREGEWFRVHELFGSALRSELARREPGLMPQLHARASAWFEENDEPDSAIVHATAAGDVRVAARLVWQHTAECLANGEVSTVERWLRGFTADVLVREAELALAAAWVALHRGQPAEHWIAAAARGHYDADRKGASEAVASGTALLRALVARNGIAQMAADARLAQSLQQPEDPWLPVALTLEAIAVLLLQRSGEAGAAVRRALVAGASYGASEWRALALSQSALLAADEDDWASARQRANEAEALCAEHRLSESALLGPVAAVQALVAAHEDPPSQADGVVGQSRKRAALMPFPAAWGEALCLVVLARARLLLTDREGARTLLVEARGALADVPDAPYLHDWVERTWRQAEMVPDEEAEPGTTLTGAELRVLQFLPTHLSFEEIGRQLFVSRNTVKTQALSVYRKLGVRSRSEAVERAQTLGLLGR